MGDKPIFKETKGGRWPRRILLLVLLLAVLWVAGLLRFVAAMPDSVAQPEGRSDAIVVLNKTDIAGAILPPDIGGRPVHGISAKTGDGLDELQQVLGDHFAGLRIQGWIRIPGRAARLRARLFEVGAVEEERIDRNGVWSIRVSLSVEDARQLQALGGEEGRLVTQQLLAQDATAA